MKIITKLFFLGFFCVFCGGGAHAALSQPDLDIPVIGFTACNSAPASGCSGVSSWVNTLTFCSNYTVNCMMRSDGTYFAYATCNTCKTGGSLVSETITLPGCSSNATKTIKNCTVPTSSCNGTCDGICHNLDIWFATGVDGYDYKQTCSCNTSTCQWEHGQTFRCAAGYYNSKMSNFDIYNLVNCSVDSSGGFSSCNGCAICPTMTSGSNTYPGKSDGGTKFDQSGCYVGYGDDVKYQDNTGEYMFSQKCNFTK